MSGESPLNDGDFRRKRSGALRVDRNGRPEWWPGMGRESGPAWAGIRSTATRGQRDFQWSGPAILGIGASTSIFESNRPVLSSTERLPKAHSHVFDSRSHT